MKLDSADNFLSILTRSKSDCEKESAKKIPKCKKDINDFLGDNDVEIVDNGDAKAKIVGWNEISSRRKFTNQPVEIWSNVNLFMYFKSICAKKNIEYKEKIECDIGLARRSIIINELFTKFEVYTGNKVDNVIIKNYMDFYVNKIVDDEVARLGKFNVYSLLHKTNIAKYYKANKQSASETVVADNSHSQNMNTIDTVYETGGVNMLVQYGIVIPFVWFVAKKNLSKSEAAKVIEAFLRDAKVEGELVHNMIEDMTVKLSPYPLSYVSEELEKIMNKHKITKVKFSINGKMYI